MPFGIFSVSFDFVCSQNSTSILTNSAESCCGLDPFVFTVSKPVNRRVETKNGESGGGGGGGGGGGKGVGGGNQSHSGQARTLNNVQH